MVKFNYIRYVEVVQSENLSTLLFLECLCSATRSGARAAPSCRDHPTEPPTASSGPHPLKYSSPTSLLPLDLISVMSKLKRSIKRLFKGARVISKGYISVILSGSKSACNINQRPLQLIIIIFPSVP